MNHRYHRLPQIDGNQIGLLIRAYPCDLWSKGFPALRSPFPPNPHQHTLNQSFIRRSLLAGDFRPQIACKHAHSSRILNHRLHRWHRYPEASTASSASASVLSVRSVVNLFLRPPLRERFRFRLLPEAGFHFPVSSLRIQSSSALLRLRALCGQYLDSVSVRIRRGFGGASPLSSLRHSSFRILHSALGSP